MKSVEEEEAMEVSNYGKDPPRCLNEMSAKRDDIGNNNNDHFKCRCSGFSVSVRQRALFVSLLLYFNEKNQAGKYSYVILRNLC